MKNAVRWAINNSPAMNTLLIASLILGAVSMVVMRREVFPEFALDVVLVSVVYPNATPSEVEDSICVRLEESLRDLEGVKKMTSIAREGGAFVVLELKSSVRNTDKLLNECRSQIDQIPNFPPTAAEDPSVQQVTFKMPAISIGVLGPESSELDELTRQKQLRAVAEDVRNGLLAQRPVKPRSWIRRPFQQMFVNPNQPAVSSALIVGERDYQIDVEVSEKQLRNYGLSLQQIAEIIGRQNREMPAGKMIVEGQEILVRGNRKRSVGHEIERIVLRSQPNGDQLTVADVAEVKDGFKDITSEHRINGRRGLVVVAQRTSSEDLFTVVDAVREYVRNKPMPEGYELRIWGDSSVDVVDRINLLSRNGLQGLVLVFIVLAIFLDLRLAFWVALGIPVSVLGAGVVLIAFGQTLNMLSMFAFLMALGIVVDDAIVIGENIYAKRETGMSFVRAAVAGTIEVIPSVTASVSTTIIAFAPLMYVSGIMGKFIAVMPIAVIAMLVISLIESAFVLPCHLAHKNNLFLDIVSLVLYVFYPVVWLLSKANQWAARQLDFLIEKVYGPTLHWALYHKSIVVCAAIALLIQGAGFVKSGIVPFSAFPKLDAPRLTGSVIYPDGTSAEYSMRGTDQMEAALMRVHERLKAENGESIVDNIHRRTGELGDQGRGPTEVMSGSHVGSLEIDLSPVGQRLTSSDEVIRQWREEVGRIPGADTVRYGSADFGPGGKKIELKLLSDGKDFESLIQAVEECKEYLKRIDGVVDIEDDNREGKVELLVRLNEKGLAANLDEEQLSQNIRAAFNGVEIVRETRGRSELKIVVRYPESERNSYSGFEEIRIRDAQGNAYPLMDIANLEFSRAASEINRINGFRSITVTADMDRGFESKSDEIIQTMRDKFLPDLMERYAGRGVALQSDWEGETQDSNDAFSSMRVGFMIALMAMFVLLTLVFRSYIQPLIILSIIPFGAIGAIFGHAILRMDLTLFSFFGLIALTGVVVNDSIVLVDFINRKIGGGSDLYDGLVEAGKRRFRPILLTSVTTVAGLFPMLLETSFQAQILIPMATSLVFGLAAGTLLILYLVPVFYGIYARAIEHLTGRPFRIASDLAAEGLEAKPKTASH